MDDTINQVRINTVALAVITNQGIYLLVSCTPRKATVLLGNHRDISGSSQGLGLRRRYLFLDILYFRARLSHGVVTLFDVAARHQSFVEQLFDLGVLVGQPLQAVIIRGGERFQAGLVLL